MKFLSNESFMGLFIFSLLCCVIGWIVLIFLSFFIDINIIMIFAMMLLAYLLGYFVIYGLISILGRLKEEFYIEYRCRICNFTGTRTNILVHVAMAHYHYKNNEIKAIMPFRLRIKNEVKKNG